MNKKLSSVLCVTFLVVLTMTISSVSAERITDPQQRTCGVHQLGVICLHERGCAAFYRCNPSGCNKRCLGPQFWLSEPQLEVNNSTMRVIETIKTSGCWKLSLCPDPPKVI